MSDPLADNVSGYGSFGGFMTNGAYVMSRDHATGLPMAYAGAAPRPPSGPAPPTSFPMPPAPPAGGGVNLAPLGKTV